MRSLRSFPIVLSALVLAGTAAAQGPLVDINTSVSTAPVDSSPTSFASLGGVTVFAADVPGLGRELCVSDGSTAQLLVDLAPGAADSEPLDLTAIGGWVWFSAWTPGSSRELFRTDGTVAGTQLVADLVAGPWGAGYPADFSQLGTDVLFTATTAIGGRGLWRSDGTSGGTTLLYDFGAALGLPAGNPTLTIADLGAKAVFGATGIGLWVTDGTSGGTVELTYAGLYSVRDVVAFGGQAYFLGTEANIGAGVWRTDGTLVEPVAAPGDLSTSPAELTPFGGDLYFTSFTPTFERALWKTDGSPGNLTQLTFPDQPGQPTYQGPTGLTAVASYLAFAATDGVDGYELWRTDGTPAGTAQIADAVPGAGSLGPSSLTAVGDRVVFRGVVGTDVEPWYSDGVVVAPLGDLAPAGSSGPTEFYGDGSTVWFSAADGAVGREPWRTDGTPAGTQLAGDVAVTPLTLGSDPYEFARIGGRVLFVADDGVHGRELWYSDGTAAGTGLLLDILPGPATSAPRDLTVLGDQVFFIVRTLDLFPYDRVDVWRTDGTTAGTGPLTDLFSLGWFDPEGLVAVGERLFFTADDKGQNGREPWTSDGTFGGTQLLGNLHPMPIFGDSNASAFTALGAGFLFRAEAPSFQSQLWWTDGTPAGTVALTDGSPAFPVSPQGLTAFGDGLALFSGYAQPTGIEPYVTDGTTAGTFQLVDLEPGGGHSQPTSFFAAGDRAIFVADTFAEGRELWTTDGTPGGTALLVDLVPGPADAAPFVVGTLGERVLFRSGSASAASLWITDGTSAGTQLLLDGSLQSPSFALTEPYATAGELFYFGVLDYSVGESRLWRTDGTMAGTIALAGGPAPNGFGAAVAIGSGNEILLAGTGVDGREVWRSRGTPQTTQQVLDVELGAADSNPSGFLRAGTNVVFTASEHLTGTELYALPFAVTEGWVAEPFGVACPSSGGLAPRIGASGAAQLGQTVALEVTDAFGPATAFLYASFGSSAVPLGGCTVYVESPLWLFGATPTDPLGSGSVSVFLPPSLVGIVNIPVYFQYAVIDPGGALFGVASLTDALEVLVGPPQ